MCGITNTESPGIEWRYLNNIKLVTGDQEATRGDQVTSYLYELHEKTGELAGHV